MEGLALWLLAWWPWVMAGWVVIVLLGYFVAAWAVGASMSWSDTRRLGKEVPEGAGRGVRGRAGDGPGRAGREEDGRPRPRSRD